MSIGKIDVLKAIESLSLNNATVCIHSSLKSFGHVEGGASSIINAFLDSGCTILVPGFIYSNSIPAPERSPLRNGLDYDNNDENISAYNKIFTVESNDISKDSLGIIPYEILQMPHRKRGHNPINSFTAIGPKATELVADQSAIDVYSPLRKMYDNNGYVILIGVTLKRMTAIHWAEQKAGRTLFVRWANGYDGKPMRVSVGSCSEGFDKFDCILKPVERNIKVGDSNWRVFPMKQIVDLCANAIMEDPMITHCGNPECERCNDAVQGGPIL